MKCIKWIIAVAISVAAGVGLYKATKIKQKKAKEAGQHVPYGPYEAFIKRPLDAVLSIIALIILSPVLLILAILVKVKLGSPVIFKQQRPGIIDTKTGKEKTFTLYKFRTMTDAKDADGNLLPDEERLTVFGKALRASSADELCELFNIAKGDMAIIGPRPLLTRYLPYYTDDERHRHDVRPGLTGASQINGRNFLSWEDRFAMDVDYTKRITFLGDLRIILKTVRMVLQKKDVMQADEDKESMTFDDLDKERGKKSLEES